MASKTNVHGPASYMMNTGFVAARLPLPGRVDLATAWAASTTTCRRSSSCPTRAGCRTTKQGNFSSGFLPGRPPGHGHQGRRRRCRSPTSSRPNRPATSRRDGRAPRAWTLLRELNRGHADAMPGDSRLEARIAVYELAARMQLSAPEVLDLSGETRRDAASSTASTSRRPRPFGRHCLIARRLLERGVRFVQVWSGAGGAAQQLGQPHRHRQRAAAHRPQVDQPDRRACSPTSSRAACSTTRSSSGRTEFGRHAVQPGAHGPRPQRRHLRRLAGRRRHQAAASPTARATSGRWKAPQSTTYCYDLHATILHLLGIDHERLTFRHNGIDRRLTDVHGHVIEDILA